MPFVKVDLAKAKNELIHLFLRLKPEAIHEANYLQMVYTAFVAPRAGAILNAPNAISPVTLIIHNHHLF